MVHMIGGSYDRVPIIAQAGQGMAFRLPETHAAMTDCESAA